MSRIYTITGLALFGFVIFIGIAVALDAPHNYYEGERMGNCNACHITHWSSSVGSPVGPGLINQNSNWNLCLSCHVDTGLAANWPFYISDQAIPGTSGTSHRWDTFAAMPATSAPNNVYGLRAASDVKNIDMRKRLSLYSNVAVCSVCHNQHDQDRTMHDPYSYDSYNDDTTETYVGKATCGSLCSNTVLEDANATWGVKNYANYYIKFTTGNNAMTEVKILSNTATTVTFSTVLANPVAANDEYYITNNTISSDSGTATGGSATSVVDTAKTTWTTDQWKGYYVKMTSGLNNGERRRITASSIGPPTLTTDTFSSAVAGGDKYYITSDRHFMRTNNVLSDLCYDCHYYRSPSAVNGSVYQTDTRIWDGNKKSHPVGNRWGTFTDPTQFNAIPLEQTATLPWATQGGTRYQLNGGSDTNLTNNIIVGIDGKISCLSCHNVHYSDSDSTTVDKPSGSAP